MIPDKPHAFDRSSTKRPPLLTWLAVGFCIALTLLNWYAGGRIGGRISAVLTSTPAQIWEGRYYGLIGNVFLHGNILHLAFNMLWLWRLGTVLEGTLRPISWLAVFTSSAVIGSCAELALSGGMAIGASGVVYAMFGLMWAGRYYQPAWKEVATPDTFWMFVGWGALCIVASTLGYLHVANGAHAGGFLFGLAVGWTIYARRRRAVAAAVVVTGLAILSALSLTWMPWSLPWTLWQAENAFIADRHEDAIELYHRTLRMGANPEMVWQNISYVELDRGNLNEATDARIKSLDAKVD